MTQHFELELAAGHVASALNQDAIEAEAEFAAVRAQLRRAGLAGGTPRS